MKKRKVRILILAIILGVMIVFGIIFLSKRNYEQVAVQHGVLYSISIVETDSMKDNRKLEVGIDIS